MLVSLNPQLGLKNSTVSGLFLSRPVPTSSQKPDSRPSPPMTAPSFLFPDISFRPIIYCAFRSCSCNWCSVQCGERKKENVSQIYRPPPPTPPPRPNCCIFAKVHDCQCPYEGASGLSFECRPPYFSSGVRGTCYHRDIGTGPGG